ncbi:MAG: hypothetical protein R2731_11065 [Nocardioides sp.]
MMVANRLLPLPGIDADELAAANRTLAAGGAVVFATEQIDRSTTQVSGRRYDADGRPAGRIGRRSVDAAFVQVPATANVPQAVLARPSPTAWTCR